MPASRHVWVIEDNPDHALLIATQLESVPAIAGITITPDGEQALQHIRSWPGQAAGNLPGLVLLDLHLPRVKGADVLLALRASDSWREVPVVVLSTSAAPGDIEMCFKNGANAYLNKSMHLPHLAVRVGELARHWFVP